MEAIRSKTHLHLHLPEEMIQHIQSFLNAKKAVRTSILSKSWYNAWLTRPNFDFSDLSFRGNVKLAEKSMQRYEDLKRKIQSFKLVIDYKCESSNISVAVAMKLIVKAIKLGATDLDIHSLHDFVLPDEVLQSPNLVRLSLLYAIVDHKVCCLRLKYLNLISVDIKVYTFWDIISMCPLIEELILCQCSLGEDKKMLESKSGEVCAYKLKLLSLKYVKTGEWIFRNFWSSRFPCLKDLTLTLDYIFDQEIQICSNSLEYINLQDADIWRGSDVPGEDKLLTAKFDVPRIRKFEFKGSRVPFLSFKKIPRDLQSHISISRFSYNKLLKLSECLHQLIPSKISLRLKLTLFTGHNDMRALPEPPIAVENLTIEMFSPRSLHHELIHDLFRLCHPSFINLYWFRSPKRRSKVNRDFKDFLSNILLIKSGEIQSMSTSHDHEEVNVEFFVWRRTLPFKTLSDALAYSSSFKVKACLKLGWQHESTV